MSPNSTWALSYNDKSYASGIVGTDIVSVGGLRVKKQSIELANNLSSSFQQNFGDGLLGLAFGTINRVTPVSVPTFPESLIAERNAPINKQVFTAYLTSYKDPKNLYGHSFYSFGHIVNKALGGQPINYVYSDNSQGLWQFQSTTATIGDQPISRFDNTAVADTGTSLMLLDDDFVDFMYNVIPGAYYDSDVQGFVYPTNLTDDQIPTIKIAVGDIEYEIRKADLAYADVGNGFTYGGIQSRGDLSFDVFGDTFLKSVYAVSDGKYQKGLSPGKYADQKRDRFSISATANLGSCRRRRLDQIRQTPITILLIIISAPLPTPFKTRTPKLRKPNRWCVDRASNHVTHHLQIVRCSFDARRQMLPRSSSVEDFHPRTNPRSRTARSFSSSSPSSRPVAAALASSSPASFAYSYSNKNWNILCWKNGR